MDILTLMVVFFLLATIIKIATDNIVSILKPFKDFQEFKLIIALVITGFGVSGLNIGVLQTLNIIGENSLYWFHYFDITLTVLFLTSGAQAIHKLSDAWTEYKKAPTNTAI